MMLPSKIFEKELTAIRDNKLRELTSEFLDVYVPEYFYEIPASSTGKYHPWYSLGYGGLVRHTKSAVLIAVDLLNLEQNKHLPSDNIIVALLVHDTYKRGIVDNGHTEFNHPILAAEQFCYTAGLWGYNDDKLDEIKMLISSHMGQWNTDNKNNVLPKPITEAQKFVHMCDYLASRKYITVEVE